MVLVALDIHLMLLGSEKPGKASMTEPLQWLHIACMDVDCQLGKPFAMVLHSANELGSSLASFPERPVLVQVQKGA